MSGLGPKTKKCARFRLTRPAACFGVRLDDDRVVVIPGLDSLIAYVEQTTRRGHCHGPGHDRRRFGGLERSRAEYLTPGHTRGGHTGVTVTTGIGNVAPKLLKVRACYYVRARGSNALGLIHEQGFFGNVCPSSLLLLRPTDGTVARHQSSWCRLQCICVDA
jgi:hypothetical protein